MDEGNLSARRIHVSPQGEFDVILRPHRSLSPRGFLFVMIAVGLVSFAAGIMFLAMGAWPVAGFFGLDAALIYWAFKLNYGEARAYERIMLTGGKLAVRQGSAKGAERLWQFEPYWVRLDLEVGPAGDNRLWLRSHGRRIAIANCLGADERTAFAAALREALAGVMRRR